MSDDRAARPRGSRATSIDVGCLVDGERVTTGTWIERQNPTRPVQMAGRAAAADEGLVDRALEAATRASSEWAVTPFEDRAARLVSAASAIDDATDQLAGVLCAELGKVIADCRGEARFAAAWLRESVAIARRVLQEQRGRDDERGRLEIDLEPYGVVVAVTPWNAPIVLTLLKLGPALATGNVVVVKPSPLAPLAVTHVVSLLADLLPPGVVQILHGGAEVGRALTTDPRVDKISFTGGLATGRAVMAAAASNVTPVVLELGGNDAAVICRDARLDDEDIRRLIYASFITTGQVCMAAKRLYVHADRLDEVRDRYIELARTALVTGDPMLPMTTLGPLVGPEDVARIAALVEEARRDGATVHELGTVPDPDLVDRGWFARPTLVTDIGDGARLVTDEQFGPTVPMLSFDDEDEVVARANAGPHGLSASVWSADEDRAFAIARRLRVGTTFINTHNRSGMALDAPFGGRGASGFGREYGEAGVRDYLVPHSIHAPAPFRAGGAGGTGAYPGT